MIELEEVRQTIARLIQKQVDIPVAKVLADTPFRELHSDFDSLALMELQLLLEKEYATDLSFGQGALFEDFPENATGLARSIIFSLSQIQHNPK